MVKSYQKTSKKVIFWLVGTVLLVLILFIGCRKVYRKVSDEKADKVTKKTMDFIQENVNKIRIRTLPESAGIFKSFEVEDSEDINAIVDFLNGIDVKKTKEDVNKYGGMSYVLTFYFDEKRTLEINLFGNQFLIINDEAYDISYQDAQKFEKLIKDIRKQ